MKTTSRNNPLLSIVCVTKNDFGGLTRTLRSLEILGMGINPEIEIIVQNGGEPIPCHLAGSMLENLKILETQDAGIYDAMNKALSRTSGEFVWFLNGGDEGIFQSWEEVKSTLRANLGCLLYFDYELAIGKRILKKKSRFVKYISHALPTSHQAIIYPGDEARRTMYPAKFRITSDYAFTALLLENGVKPTRVHMFLARFHSGGLSTLHSQVIVSEANRVQREILGLPLVARLISHLLHRASNFRSRLRNRVVRKHQDGT